MIGVVSGKTLFAYVIESNVATSLWPTKTFKAVGCVSSYSIH